MTSYRPFLPIAAACAVAAAPVPVLADEYVDRVNAIYAQIRPEHRSDEVLLPLLAKMEAPPAAVASIDKAMMLPHGGTGWQAAESWANGAAQRAALEGLAKVTLNTDMAFGQPYGADAVAGTSQGVTLVQAGLYTDLGDPALLAAAKFLYLPAIENLGCLVNVEATRLAGEGKIDEAIKVLGDWVFFSRQMADREFFQECRWGMRSMIAALERIRDVAYVDFRTGDPKLSIDRITAVLDRLKTDDGYLMGNRLTFPSANRVAAQQAVAFTFAARGGPNENFGQTMARLASTKRPLRLFSEAASWDSTAGSHGNWFETNDQIDRVHNDWDSRWGLRAFDKQNSRIPDYDRTSRSKFALIKAIVPDMSVLFNDREVLRTQLIGTRTALAVLAFSQQNKQFPVDLASVRPRYIKVIDPDPFNPSDLEMPLMYFVPIRDQPRSERQEPRPHEINVLTAGGQSNFKVQLREDQFVLYSVGPDGAKSWAVNVSGEPGKGAVGDLLLWPPVTSLLRQRLVELGQIK